MKVFCTAALITLLATGSSIAGGVIDLPNLTWPAETTAPDQPVTQSCADPVRPAGAETCADKG